MRCLAWSVLLCHDRGNPLFVEFLRRLLREGSVVLTGPPAVRDGERPAAAAVLAEAFRPPALDVAGPSVPFDAEAALAAAALVWRACWFLVQRGGPPAEVEAALALPPGRG